MPVYYESREPFVGWRVYGPYDNNRIRKLILLIRPDGTRTGMDLGRFKMCLQEGRLLDRLEHVDHVNDDPSDNGMENLQILSPGENIRKSHPGLTIGFIEVACSWCDAPLLRNPARRSKSRRTDPYYCDQRCGTFAQHAKLTGKQGGSKLPGRGFESRRVRNPYENDL